MYPLTVVTVLKVMSLKSKTVGSTDLPPSKTWLAGKKKGKVLLCYFIDPEKNALISFIPGLSH